ncbi:MAG: hypothetical protein ACKOI2_13535 [Actinomycetota bacterium]
MKFPAESAPVSPDLRAVRLVKATETAEETAQAIPTRVVGTTLVVAAAQVILVAAEMQVVADMPAETVEATAAGTATLVETARVGE